MCILPAARDLLAYLNVMDTDSRYSDVIVGSLVDHPVYGPGLITAVSTEPAFATRQSTHRPDYIIVCSVLWNTGELQTGWPANRLVDYLVLTSII